MDKSDAEKKLEPGTVVDPMKLVGYNEGSIVSRTIIEEETGTVTLFSFDRGQSLSEHSAPYDALVQVIDGTGEFTISENRFEVPAGKMILLPAGIPHSVRAPGRFRMILTMIKR